MEAYTKAKYGEFRTMIGSIWAPLVEKGLSYAPYKTTKDSIDILNCKSREYLFFIAPIKVHRETKRRQKMCRSQPQF